jgi:hypothetical protein
MADQAGKIVLMGSGELTASMVEVHKSLLRPLGASARAVFLDTPAGFQLNADQIATKAFEYFRHHIGHPLTIASYKDHGALSDYDRQQAGRTMRQADYILIGPGSPTYALRQWHPSPVPDLLADCVTGGGTLVAASAAALTVGRFTLPVYEIYKVGQELHWVDGLDLLARFGFDLVVVPHWNNAEGGNHDTRFCFMGGQRFDALEAMLPEPRPVLGLDEHTACILDLATSRAEVRGIGAITLRTPEGTMAYQSGEQFDLAVLREGRIVPDRAAAAVPVGTKSSPGDAGQAFWQEAHDLEARFQEGLARDDPRGASNALLAFDRLIWRAQEGAENEAVVVQARDTLRDMIVTLGNQLDAAAGLQVDDLAPLVEALLALREKFRRERQWEAADGLRAALDTVNIQVEDAPEGARWHFSPSERRPDADRGSPPEETKR